MAIQDKTTLKSYFETGDIPTEGQFVDLIDSTADLNATYVVIGGLTIYDADGDNLHFEVEYSVNADFSSSVSAVTSTSQTNWAYFNGTQYADFPSGGLASAYQNTVLGSVIYKIPAVISYAGVYVRARAYDGFDWGNYVTSFGYGSVTVGRGNLTNLVYDTTPQLGGDLDLNEKYIALTPSPASDDTGSGTIATMTVDANATGVGAALHMDTNGNWVEANASAVTTMPCMSLALETGTGSKKVLLNGFIRNNGWTWAIGGNIYVSATTGLLTQTAPAITGDQVQLVGIATQTNIMYFNPNQMLIEIA